MRDHSNKSAWLRVVVLSVALVGVIAFIVWMQRPQPTPAAAPSASTSLDAARAWEADLIRSAASASEAGAPGKITHTIRDKARRDQMRELIYKAYGLTAPPPGKPPPRGNSPHAPLGADAGTISPEYIQSRIREDFVPLAKQCYEAAIERDAGKAGKLVLGFVIVGDEDIGGIVESVETVKGTTLDDPELLTCLRESMLSLSFAPPPHGGSVTVTYPFTFDPGDGG